MISFSLLETMRLEGGHIVRLDRHLSRMAASARYFGYGWDETAIRSGLDTCARSHPEGCWRVRLLVPSTGAPSIECTIHPAGASGAWRVAFARAHIDRDDPFLFNKTTHRVIYDDARHERPDVDEILLWNERDEVTEATIANVVVEIDGLRYTPPVSCGLLGGVFRAELLESGVVREQVLTKTSVAHATRLWLINSLREWIDISLVD